MVPGLNTDGDKKMKVESRKMVAPSRQKADGWFLAFSPLLLLFHWKSIILVVAVWALQHVKAIDVHIDLEIYIKEVYYKASKKIKNG